MIIWATAGKLLAKKKMGGGWRVFRQRSHKKRGQIILIPSFFFIVEPTKYLDMKWEPEKGKYFTPFTQKIYIFLFVSLNVIMVYWFAMIVRVITRVLQGNNAEDTRSDDEDEDE